MTEPMAPRRFHESDGVEDWRVLNNRACALFRTGSFARGVELVDAIGRLADAADHHPDVDLRYPAVTVRLETHDAGGLSQRDVDLARQISGAARELGLSADPSAVQFMRIAIDTARRDEVLPFWRALMGYRVRDESNLDDPLALEAPIWFQDMTRPRAHRNRIHIDLSVPHDHAVARVAAALTAGGRLISDSHAPAWWTLADPEGNEVDVCTWRGRQ
ncbi:MAG TPA: VOC family protein [Stackebrandtia sp.]|jgi:4a-hydroxytetrahydrobiopterin dehydratase|uniref:VOC family protein n=1 Tax=Stackebrandtia sp. TaxID=2023065 RepID=UPI002D70455E|nr:VOC family protein [Stackebrandtia sp.]HZE38998.1 VOC family protein [Stackebrandtia sp.]